MSAPERRPLPAPRPPTTIRTILGLLAGFLGTGLLYEGATRSSLGRLLIGTPLFGLGLLMVGWPFVLATAHRSAALRAGPLRRGHRGRGHP